VSAALEQQVPSPVSPGDLAVAGFGVIARDWRLVVGWSLFNLLALLVGSVFLFMVLLVVVPLAGPTVAPTVGVIILTAGSVAVQVMIVSALFRRMLRDGPPEFLYLRLGPDEGRLFAVALLGGVAIGAPFALAAAAAAAAPHLGGWTLLAAFALVIWLLFRLSLIGPSTFAERRIDLAAAWRLTRGHELRLLGVAILVAFLTAMVELALWIAITFGTGAIGGFQDLFLADADAFAQHPARYLLSMTLNLAALPFLLTLIYAPWAAAYRAIKA
jgi:hypothetical protein